MLRGSLGFDYDDRGVKRRLQQLVSNLERVVVPVTEVNSLYERGPWMLRARYRGQDALVVVHKYKSRLAGVSFGVWLGGRPITLTVHETRTNMVGLPLDRGGLTLFSISTSSTAAY